MIRLPTISGGFACVAADPPWRFASNSEVRPGRNAMRHYACMTLAEIEALPVRDAIARDAVLWLWVPGPFLAIGAHVPIMRAWGFAPAGIGFTWAKQTRDRSRFHVGNGFTTRKSCEFCLIGKRGRSLRRDAGVRELIVAPKREHSRKPDEFYALAERYSPGPRLDLFARETRPDWTAWGAEAGKFDPPAISAQDGVCAALGGP